MLYFRVDMNEIIATGHVMRCLSIADAAKRIGEDSTFILADNKGEELIEKRGYKTVVLNTDWNHMESELSALADVIKDNNIKCILIDSYQVTESYLKQLSEMVKTLYMDDLNAFHYPVDGIICYANYWSKFNYEENYNLERLLLGPAYAPLRKEFARCKAKEINEKAERLLFMSGGSDSYDILARLLESIDKDKYSDIDVICGMLYEKYEELSEKYKTCSNIHIHKAVSNMDEYMDKADIAVSAGGSTLYELCAKGTPTISYAFADNQHNNVVQFDDDGIIEYAGDIRTDDIISNINNLLGKYYSDKELRQKKSILMQQVVDGNGAERIAAELIKMNQYF